MSCHQHTPPQILPVLFSSLCRVASNSELAQNSLYTATFWVLLSNQNPDLFFNFCDEVAYLAFMVLIKSKI